MKPPRARFNDGQQRTPRILNVEVQQRLTNRLHRTRRESTSEMSSIVAELNSTDAGIKIVTIQTVTVTEKSKKPCLHRKT
jgi:hypothetical protein